MSSNKRSLTKIVKNTLLSDIAGMAHDIIDIAQVYIYGDEVPPEVAANIQARIRSKHLANLDSESSNTSSQERSEKTPSETSSTKSETEENSNSEN